MSIQTICPKCRHAFTADQLWHAADGCVFPSTFLGGDGVFNCPSCKTELTATFDPIPDWTLTVSK